MVDSKINQLEVVGNQPLDKRDHVPYTEMTFPESFNAAQVLSKISVFDKGASLNAFKFAYADGSESNLLGFDGEPNASYDVSSRISKVRGLFKQGKASCGNDTFELAQIELLGDDGAVLHVLGGNSGKYTLWKEVAIPEGQTLVGFRIIIDSLQDFVAGFGPITTSA